MVFLTVVLRYVKKKVPRQFLKRGYIDSLRLHVTGGPGGSGLPRYGGIGGQGGNVYLVARKDITLEKLNKIYVDRKIKAGAGGESTRRGIIGVPGQDLRVEVPVGITVYTDTGAKLGELNENGGQLLVAKGGHGGCAETGYYGIRGEVQNIILDLKLIADVGLIGFPNAGKSTFLHAISNAKPKIANYPFTTLRPNIGIIEYPDHRQITVADLPGLIENAHANYGMGHKFLKHLERTKLLLFIIDIQGFQLSPTHYHRSCMETLALLNREIELYDPDLLNMPAILLINKMDTENAEDIYERIKPQLDDLSQYISECEEHMRSTKIVKFDRILTASLCLKKPEELDKIKDVLRGVIDANAEKEYFANNKNIEAKQKLLQRIQKLSVVNTPPLV